MGIHPVFLLYVSRSGSTFFANQLARRSSDVVVLPELDVVNLLCDAGDDQLQAMSSREIAQFVELDERFRQLGVATKELQDQIEARGSHQVIDLLSAIGQVYAGRCGKPAARFAMYQRGNILSVADQLCPSSEMPTRFIHLFRDPRGCLNSIQNVRRRQTTHYDRRRIGRCDAAGIAKAWNRYVQNVEKLDTHPVARLLKIQYEQLCRDLPAELQRCADFLNVPLASEQSRRCNESVVSADAQEIHENIDEQVIASRANAWRRELSGSDVAIVESIAAAEMKRHGYAVIASDGNVLSKLQLVAALAKSSVITASIRFKTLLHACSSPTQFRLHWRHYRRRLESARNV